MVKESTYIFGANGFEPKTEIIATESASIYNTTTATANKKKGYVLCILYMPQA